MKKITIEELKEALRKSWSKETSYDPKGWTPENPAWGQCAITVFVVQDYLGGNIKAGFIKGLAYHYWNQLPDGSDEDFTKEQFKEKIEFLAGEIIDTAGSFREFLLLHRSTKERYLLLKEQVEKYLENKETK